MRTFEAQEAQDLDPEAQDLDLVDNDDDGDGDEGLVPAEGLDPTRSSWTRTRCWPLRRRGSTRIRFPRIRPHLVDCKGLVSVCGGDADPVVTGFSLWTDSAQTRRAGWR